MPRGQGHTAYLTMYREEARMYSRTAIKTAGGVPPLESNRRGLQRRRHPERSPT